MFPLVTINKHSKSNSKNREGKMHKSHEEHASVNRTAERRSNIFIFPISPLHHLPLSASLSYTLASLLSPARALVLYRSCHFYY